MKTLVTVLSILGMTSFAQAQTQRPACPFLAAQAAKSLWSVNSGIDMKDLDAKILSESKGLPKIYSVVVTSALTSDKLYRVVTAPIANSDSCHVVQVNAETAQVGYDL